MTTPPSSATRWLGGIRHRSVAWLLLLALPATPVFTQALGDPAA